jgi:pimeloyl-ACP methyl ester carboxylesterase
MQTFLLPLLAASLFLVSLFEEWTPIARPPVSRPPVSRPTGAIGDLVLERRAVTLDDGTEVDVDAGTLLVPERRDRDDSPTISLPFYRVRSTAEAPAPALFLLAGGPGSSWLGRFGEPDSYAEIQRYAETADVVVFDQRGAGGSLPALDCDHGLWALPHDVPFDVEVWGAELATLSRTCRDHWTEQGVDLAGYTTVENAADVHALRRALGYEKISLLGGSYGSHLAFAAMREDPQALFRVVLFGVEGPDHTWDDPGGRLATLERIAAAAEASTALAPAIPKGGLLAALRETIERLEDDPVVVPVRRGDETLDVVVDAELVRIVASFQAGKRRRPSAWPHHVLRLHAGDYSFVAQGALMLRRIGLDRPMHYMMDCASGISTSRQTRYDGDPARALLGDVNMEYRYLCQAWRAPDLGEAFRAPLRCDVPTLIVHGTWDMSTPIENARETAAALKNSQLVEVVGGGHGALYSLYEYWPPAHAKLAAFLRGERVELPKTVTIPPVDYTPFEVPR